MLITFFIPDGKYLHIGMLNAHLSSVLTSLLTFITLVLIYVH